LEDDAEALGILFAVPHHKRGLLPKDIPMHVLFQVAVLADKYNVVGVLRQTAVMYLRERLPICCIKTGLLIAWTFGLSKNFAAYYGVLVYYLHKASTKKATSSKNSEWMMQGERLDEDHLPSEILGNKCPL
jgi:hypothetical protein